MRDGVEEIGDRGCIWKRGKRAESGYKGGRGKDRESRDERRVKYERKEGDVREERAERGG